MRAYDPILSALLTQKFEPPLQPSNVPDPLPQILPFPLQTLALNPLPPLSVLLQGRGRPILIPSVAHVHVPFIYALRLQQGVPPLLPSHVPAPLPHLSALPCQ